MAQLMTQRAYARHRGVSQPAVNKAIKSGRIKLVEGKIDAEQADKEWAANTNGGGKLKQAAISGGAQIDTGGAPAGNTGPRTTQDPAIGWAEEVQNAVSYAESRAVHEGYRARIAKLELDVKTGKLIESDAVRVKWFNLTRRARDILLGLPDRLSPVLAGEINQFEIHRILLEELRRVCDDLSGNSTAGV